MEQYCPYCMTQLTAGGPCPRCGADPAAYRPAAHHFPPGTLLHDRYLVGRVLGEGGFGVTYLGWDAKLERRVAVKEYFPTALVKRESSVTLEVTCYTGSGQQHYEKGRERFLQEARTLAKLDGIPEIVRVLDFFPAHNTAYIVMEFLEGQTLKDLLEAQGPLPASTLLPMLEPTIRAMAAMHRAGVIHRDISPDNLMRMKNGSVKLMDFGCARELDTACSMTVMLKHGFAPYEQYTGRDQGPWSDVYSLCATIYYCLTGRIPVDAMERRDQEADPLTPPTQLGADLTPRQERALLLGLAIRAQNRWAGMEDLYGALYEKAVDGGAWTPPPLWTASEQKTEHIPTDPVKDPEPAPAPKKRPLSRRVLAAAAAAVCVVLIAAAALALPALRSPVQKDADQDVSEEENRSLSSEEEDVHQEEEKDLSEDVADITPDELLPQEDEEPDAETGQEEPDKEETPSTTGGQTSSSGGSKPSSGGQTGSSGSQPSSGTGGQTTAPADPPPPSRAELEAQMETYIENLQFSEAAAVCRQMHQLEYVSSDKLSNLLLDVASAAENYWYETDYGNDSSPYIRLTFELFTEAANMGNTRAYACIAYYYDYGHYVAADPVKAREWWTKLANTGDCSACVFVAEYYADGIGVPQDIDMAIYWLEKALEYGESEDAREMLAELQGG